MIWKMIIAGLAAKTVIDAKENEIIRYVVKYKDELPVHTGIEYDISSIREEIISSEENLIMKENIIVEHGGEIIKHLPLVNSTVIQIKKKDTYELLKDENIEFIEKDVPIKLAGWEPATEEVSWGTTRIGAVEQWRTPRTETPADGTYQGQNVNIAIIDTGIDTNHPDLINNIQGGMSTVTETYEDDHGHGTKCAGIIAAEYNKAGIIGIAPKANIYAIKILYINSSGDLIGSGSDIIPAIEWSILNNIHVISMSIGTGITNSHYLEAAYKKAYEANIILVGAMGNDSSATPRYPAADINVIAVSATDISDNLANFSNYGITNELAAPGVSITTTTKGGYYGSFGGTSAACPHVAGAVALLLNSEVPDEYDIDGSGIWTPEKIRQRLCDSAYKVNNVDWDKYYGYGIVDALKAINWNKWDDDNNISNIEISMAEYHWATQIPINGHIISNEEISLLEYQWATNTQ